jgi:hypothetical protein
VTDSAGEKSPVAQVPDKEESGYHSAYADFAKNLRVWLLAYGIGAPILLVSEPRVAESIAAAPDTRLIISLFFAGVALQIGMAVLYKAAMWYMYLGELKGAVRATTRYRISDWLTMQFWIEISADICTIALFGVATLRVLFMLTA